METFISYNIFNGSCGSHVLEFSLSINFDFCFEIWKYKFYKRSNLVNKF